MSTTEFYLPQNFCLTNFWYDTELSSTGGLEEARLDYAETSNAPSIY